MKARTLRYLGVVLQLLAVGCASEPTPPPPRTAPAPATSPAPSPSTPPPSASPALLETLDLARGHLQACQRRINEAHDRLSRLGSISGYLSQAPAAPGRPAGRREAGRKALQEQGGALALRCGSVATAIASAIAVAEAGGVLQRGLRAEEDGPARARLAGSVERLVVELQLVRRADEDLRGVGDAASAAFQRARPAWQPDPPAEALGALAQVEDQLAASLPRITALDRRVSALETCVRRVLEDLLAIAAPLARRALADAQARESEELARAAREVEAHAAELGR